MSEMDRKFVLEGSQSKLGKLIGRMNADPAIVCRDGKEELSSRKTKFLFFNHKTLPKTLSRC